jgi:indole-3-pyruvate monooxygenase
MRLAVGDLSKWGIVRPAMGLNAMIDKLGRVPMLDIGTIALVKAGRIRVVPGVRELASGCARFDDGAEQRFDAIVFATGYRAGLHDIVEGFDAIADERGRPHRFGEQTDIPGLYFVGFRNPGTGALREIAIEATKVAAAIGSKLMPRDG